jgi:GTP cyclohydrolase II
MTDVTQTAVSHLVATTLTTEHGIFRLHGYDAPGDVGHVALVMGEVATGGTDDPGPLVRVHSECLTGDALGSWRCDCGEQLQAALREISVEGRGVLIYLRGHEGRGIGLLAKLRAYALQDEGLDTIEANLRLGFPADAREYGHAADILRDLGVRRIRLLSSNPDKSAKLASQGIEITSRHSLRVSDRPENAFYLKTKRLKMGHDSQGGVLDVWQELLRGVVPESAAAGLNAILLDRYGPLVAAGPQVTIGQLAQSADGFIATRTGDAEYVSGSQDREHLHRLRALSDAVIVGANTVLEDNPRLTVRAVDGRSPTRVVLDPTARVSADRWVLAESSSPTLWCVSTTALLPRSLQRHVSTIRLPTTDTGFDPAEVLRVLRDHNLGRVLVEGGGRTVSAFLSAGLLDRLYLTIAPVLIGDGVPGLRFTGTDRLADALRAPVRRFAFGADICTEFDLAAARQRG